METKPRDPRDERRVGGDTGTVGGATQTGCLATGSLDTSGIEIGATEVTEAPQQEGDPIYLIPEEDGISPNDAPEVALEDVEEEGNGASMMEQLGCPQTADDAIKAMGKRQEDEALLGLGTLCVVSNEKDKMKGRGKDNARRKKKQQKPKKKKDRSFIEDGIRRICAAGSIAASSRNSTANDLGRLNPHQYQHGDLGTLGAFNFQGDGPGGSPIEPQSRALPPTEVWPAPVKSPPTPDEHKSLPLFADGGNINRSTVNDSILERAITGGLEAGAQDGETVLPAPVAADRAANISTSRKGVDVFDKLRLQHYRSAPLVEGHSDEEEEPVHTDAIGSPLAQREVGQVGAEVATVSFGLQVDASIDSYPRYPHDLDIEAGPGDRQEEVSIPMDEDELQPSFGVLSNTTFDPVLAYRPHPYDHSINIQQDGLVGEDNNLVDLAMEDAGTETEKAMAPVTTTESLQAFSWIPPSASSAFHAIFTGVSFAQTAALVDRSTHVMESPMLSNPYTVDMTISEGVRLQHAFPPQGTAWPFVPSATQLLPSVEPELFKEREYFIPTPSPTPLSSIFDSQTTSQPPFSPISSPASRAGPVPVSPSACRPTEKHGDEVRGPNREVDPKPAVVASFQRKASPLSLGLHRVINLDTDAWQPLTPAANNNLSLPHSFCPSAVGTTETNYSFPTSSTPVERNETEDEKDGHSEGVHAIVDAVLAITQHGTEKAPPPTDAIAQYKPSPPVPPRIVGSKRKFVEDRSTYSNSINPARKKAKLPRSKKQKIEHEDYSTHKRLGEVKTMRH